jgi:hypothetical protein
MRYLLSLLFFIPVALFAQFPEDALRYGYPAMSGTARNMAIGGAMGSLGGDITAAHINPAGIGLYKNSEIVLSPAFQFGRFSYDYLNESTSSKKNNFMYGTSGFVSGSPNARYRKATSSAFSISVNQTANYNNSIKYQGANNQSSWSEKYLEELVRDNVQDFNRLEFGYPLGSSLAFWTFLIDTIANGPNIGGYQGLVPVSSNNAIQQMNQIETRGGAHEISLAFANNYNDKFYLGGSINFPVYSFKKEQTYREEDLSGDNDNDFSFFEYKGNSETSGFGMNAKLGVIVKPVERLRLGLAFHTPTIAGMTDRYSASITTNTENYTNQQQPLSQNSGELHGGVVEYEYNLTTPYRAIGSLSYVLNEVRDVKQQKGFITADIEYVNHRGVRYSELNEADADYYDALNEVIKERYKGAINFKVGGEVKFEKIMARAGFATFGNPYSEVTGLKANRTSLSGGLGYRHMGMFVDLTYVHSFIGDSHIPYFLTDKPNTVADANNSRGGIMLTVGFKL